MEYLESIKISERDHERKFNELQKSLAKHLEIKLKVTLVAAMIIFLMQTHVISISFRLFFFPDRNKPK